MTEVWEVQCFSTHELVASQAGQSTARGCLQHTAGSGAPLAYTYYMSVTSPSQLEHTCPHALEQGSTTPS